MGFIELKITTKALRSTKIHQVVSLCSLVSLSALVVNNLRSVKSKFSPHNQRNLKCQLLYLQFPKV